MQTLSPTEEQSLLTAVKTAVDYVDNDNMSPDNAITKVARDNKLSPGFVKAAVSAYNNGRQVAQFHANDSILDKLASFSLADYDNIYNNIWGGTTKQAKDHYTTPARISAEYELPPSFIRDAGQEKLAHLDITGLLGDRHKPAVDSEHQQMLDKHASDLAMRKAWSAHRDATHRFEGQRSKLAHANDMVRVHVGLLTNYFKKIAMDRMPFSVVDDAVQTYHGARGRSLMNHVAAQFPREKRAADTRVFWDRPINHKAQPFTFVENAIKSAEHVHECRAVLQQTQEDVKVAEDALRPFALPPQDQSQQPFSISLINDESEKRAFFNLVGASAVGAGTKSMLDNTLGGQGEKDYYQKTMLKLDDPDHESELRRIRAEAMLSSMMSDSENPISGYDPDQVLNAYNEIAQLAPRAAVQPAAIQPLLAKRLAGNIEPFEVQEMTNLEKGLKDVKQQPINQRQLSQNATQFDTD